MGKELIGEKIAVLVANGFCEHDLTQVQRALQESGANIRIVSMDHGLVNSWNGSGWGLHFAADQVLNSALAADFSMLLIPGGQRSVDKLKLTAHTRRFIGGFIDAQKPVVSFGCALDLLMFSGKVSARTITGPEDLKAEAVALGANWSDEMYTVDGNLMTGDISDEMRPEFVAAAADFLMAGVSMDRAA